MLKKILGSLFPLFFIGIGAMFIIKAGIPVTQKYIDELDFTVVEASYVSGQLSWEDLADSKKRKYTITATYQYENEGNTYRLEKVEEYKYDTAYTRHKYKLEDLEDELKKWEREGSIQLKVKLDEPTVYQDQQDIGIGAVLMSTLFPFVFVLIGVLILWAIFRKKNKPDEATKEKPWLLKKDWKSNVLSCNTKAKRNGAIFFALFWSAISMPMAYVLFLSGRPVESYAVYITLIFPFIGIILIISAIKKIIDFNRFGTVQLIMDPFPASIGGDFGGTLHFQGNLPEGATVAIKLNCLKLKKTGSGDNRSTEETLLWYTTGHAFIHSKDIEFRLPLEEGLQETSMTSMGIHYRAEISVSYDNHHFDRQFEIPVFATDEKSSISLNSAKNPAAKEHASELINDVTEFTKKGEDYIIRFPILRINKLGLLLSFILGSLLLAISIYNILYQAMPIVFTIVFGFIGLVFFGLSMFEAFFSLKVQLKPQHLQNSARWMGIPFVQKSIKKEQIDSFLIGDYFKKNAKGGKHTSYYKISLITNDQKKVLVAIRLKNKATAEEMKHFFETYYQIQAKES